MKYYILCIFSFVLAHLAHAQDVPLALTKGNGDYTPSNFNVVQVVDARSVKGPIGTVKEGNLVIGNGIEKGIKDYLQPGPDNALQVNMHINKLEVKEKNLGGKRQFDLAMSIAYYVENTKLLEYNGSSYAQSNTNAAPYIEKLLRQSINNNLKQFDTWAGKNKTTVSAEPEVEVHVYFSNLAKSPDQISYSKTKQLYITDFKGEPDINSPGAAATMSGINMKYQSSTLRNKTTVNVTVSVYFDKTRSWMKDNGKNSTTLMHEQRHFDITAIKACELKQLIESTAFTPDSYKTQLTALLDRVQKEGADMQNLYDEETIHGTVIDEQAKWDKKVAELLSQQKCY